MRGTWDVISDTALIANGYVNIILIKSVHSMVLCLESCSWITYMSFLLRGIFQYQKQSVQKNCSVVLSCSYFGYFNSQVHTGSVLISILIDKILIALNLRYHLNSTD